MVYQLSPNQQFWRRFSYDAPPVARFAGDGADIPVAPTVTISSDEVLQAVTVQYSQTLFTRDMDAFSARWRETVEGWSESHEPVVKAFVCAVADLSGQRKQLSDSLDASRYVNIEQARALARYETLTFWQRVKWAFTRRLPGVKP